MTVLQDTYKCWEAVYRPALCGHLLTLPFPEPRDGMLSNHSPADRLQLMPNTPPNQESWASSHQWAHWTLTAYWLSGSDREGSGMASSTGWAEKGRPGALLPSLAGTSLMMHMQTQIFPQKAVIVFSLSSLIIVYLKFFLQRVIWSANNLLKRWNLHQIISYETIC